MHEESQRLQIVFLLGIQLAARQGIDDFEPVFISNLS